MCCNFSNHLFWIKPWSLFSAFTNNKQTFSSTFKCCTIMVFVLIYANEQTDIKVQHNIQLWRRCAHVAFFKKPMKLTVLFYSASSHQSEMVGRLRSKSLMRYETNYSRMEQVKFVEGGIYLVSSWISCPTSCISWIENSCKTFLEKRNIKVQDVSTQQSCCTFVLHF